MSDEPTRTRVSDATRTRLSEPTKTSASEPTTSRVSEPTRSRVASSLEASSRSDATQTSTPGRGPAVGDATQTSIAGRGPAAGDATQTRIGGRGPATHDAAHVSTAIPGEQPADPLVGLDAVEFGEGHALRGRYLLETMIGSGAMGQVWKAKDLFGEQARDRNPFVAIKVLTSDFEDHPQAFVAMHREASRAQQLAHPNIVTVHSFDRDDRGGRVFIAMELLSGSPLDRVVRGTNGRGLAPNEAWPIIRGIGEGLAYAHRKGIVHSDLKPANIFLTEERVPKVLDFGIARAARQADSHGPVHEDDSVFSGYTATYAPPEVFDDAPPHTADDVFALGTVAYELLTGRHPFNRKPANEARAERLRPQPIKGITRRQWHAIERALAFQRARRWPDAASFLRALQGITRTQIVLAAAVAVLSVTAGILWYRNYLQSLPAIPFEQLPVAEQQYIQRALDNGNEALRLVQQSHIIEATADAADSFAEAYEHHPRNPQAAAGLKAAADAFITWADAQPDREVTLTELRSFQAKSVYYAQYGPLERAITRAQTR